MKSPTNIFLLLLTDDVFTDNMRFYSFFAHNQGVQGPKGQKGEPYVLPPDIASQYRVCAQPL